MSRRFSPEITTDSTRNLPIRVLIVDDQKFVRARIEEILSLQPDIEIVGMADDGKKAIALIKSLEPDVVLMDIEMPKLNGIKVTKIVSENCSKSKVLAISTHTKTEYIQQIINAGADGYILKHTPAPELVTAIHAVHKGYSHFGPKILQKAQLVSVANKSLTKSVNPQNYPPQQQDSRDYCRLVDQPLLVRQTTNESVLSTQSNFNSLQQSEQQIDSPERRIAINGVAIILLFSLIVPLNSLKYKTVVRANATVSAREEVKIVRAQAPGKIAEILIQPGDKVRLGQTIATFDFSQQQTTKTQLEKAIAQGQLQLSQVNSRIVLTESQTQAEIEHNRAEIQVAEAQLIASQRSEQAANLATRSKITRAKTSLQTASAKLKTAQDKLVRYQSVGAAGGLSQEYLLEAELEVLEQEQEIATLQVELQQAITKLNSADNRVEVARQNIESNKKSGEIAIAKLNGDTATLHQERSAIEYQLEQDNLKLSQLNSQANPPNLTATATGKISQLALNNPGQIIEPGEKIAQIVSESDSLKIKAQVVSQNLDEIELGQSVEIRFDSCPEAKYGTLQGKISQTSANIKQSSGDRVNSNQGEFAQSENEIVITPASLKLGQGNNVCTLKPGMETSAEIITRKESMWEFLLRKMRLVENA